MFVSHKAAKAAGGTLYYTGKPCKRGHVSERYVSNLSCVVCVRACSQLQHQKNPKRVGEYFRRNPEAKRTANRRYQSKHKARFYSLLAKRRAAKLSATPPWLSPVDLVEIEGIYNHAQVLTEITGSPHDVDHIVPLQGKNVCGLHVPWNLQAIPASINRSKSNSTDQADCASVYDEDFDVWHLSQPLTSQI